MIPRGRVLLVAAAVIFSAPSKAEAPSPGKERPEKQSGPQTLLPFWKANFHAHAAADAAGDDGDEAPLLLHRTLSRFGYDFSAHTPHSGDDAGAAFAQQRKNEAALRVPGLTIAVGEELTVAHGPAYHAQGEWLGGPGPGNLDHLSVIGAARYFPSGTPMETACRGAHEDGGVCIVNHPGPGPLLWEAGLWERPENRALVDGIEVYNGQGLAVTGLDFELRYLEASAYAQLGMKVAAIAGTDTHGENTVARARSHLPAVFRSDGRSDGKTARGDGGDRLELKAATYVQARSPSLVDMLDAIRERRTVATWDFDARGLACPGLGEVRRSDEAALHLHLPRRARVTLYREGVAIKTWDDADDVEYRETLTRPAAYVFGARTGSGRLLTSAIYYEPPMNRRTP